MRVNNDSFINKYNIRPEFRGHTGAEVYFRNSLGRLIHETAFFRDHTSNMFLKDYILKNWLNKHKINILSLGCSTGEEVITQSMMLDCIKDKIDILGIDISRNAIDAANSRIYRFERINDYLRIYHEMANISPAAYKDSFLVYRDPQQVISNEDKEKIEMFDNFFRIYDKSSFIHNLLKKILLLFTDSSDKRVILRNNKANNCKFQQGDILNAEKYLHGEKASVILFRNTLYHFTTEDDMYGIRVAKKNAQNIIENICNKLKKVLAKDGIICFGENEYSQLVLEKDVVPKIMKKIGFTPLNETKNREANIWQIKNNTKHHRS